MPVAVVFLLGSIRIHPAYGLTWRRRFALGVRIYRNTNRVFTGLSYRAHLAMAAKILEIPPSVEGVVVECGCYMGGTTANLSLVCDIAGRRLIAYDSFEGLPAAEPTDKFASAETEGFLAADLEAVKANVARLGVPERCEFRKGWFRDTLSEHSEPIVTCLLDVDYQSSLHDCIVNLWPHLTDKAYVFVDEYRLLDYCALFFSESWWSRHLDRDPPGLFGVGAGVGVGQYFLGPHTEPLQSPQSIAYTRKDFRAVWEYQPPPDETSVRANS